MTLQEQVRQAALAKGWSIRELARQSGVEAENIRRWLNGQNEHLVKLPEVLDALGLEVVQK